jgi:hypothetical protein
MHMAVRTNVFSRLSLPDPAKSKVSGGRQSNFIKAWLVSWARLFMINAASVAE